ANAPRCRIRRCDASRACGSESRTAGRPARRRWYGATDTRWTWGWRCNPYALLQRRPLVVDDTEHVVALRDGVHQHADREEVVDLLERLVALPYLLVDGPQVL